MVVRSKRILSTPLPVILHLHSCGECGLGTVVGSLDQGSQYWTSKEYKSSEKCFKWILDRKMRQKFADKFFVVVYIVIFRSCI